jgi:hypothetical protein
MANPVTLVELQDLALQAYDAEQMTLAGCLHMIIHASEKLTLDGLFAVMTAFNKDTLEVNSGEEAEKQSYTNQILEPPKKV